MSNPSYFSILTAEVRYSKEISDGEKIMFSEITALTQKYGYCVARNSYFAKLYGLSNQAISNRIANLEKAGFIRCEIDKKSGNNRKIFLSTSPTKAYTQEMDSYTPQVETPIHDSCTPYTPQVETYNNTSLSIQEGIEKEKKSSQDLQSDDAKEIEESFFSFFWNNYPKKTGKAACLKKYCSLLKNKTTRQKVHDEIMFGLSQYVSQKEDWRNWQNPLTFLNGKTWKDYTLDKPFEEQPQKNEFINWKDEAKEMENGRYIPGGWGAERGESTDQWRARFFAWKKVGLHNWWDKHNHCWTFTEQTKAQWLALHKKADGLMGVAA